MTTRADLRMALRNRLEDTTPNSLWDDTILHDVLGEALHRYSARFPAQRTETVVAIGGERFLPLTDVQHERDVVRVFRPDGEILRRSVEGDRVPGWRFWNGGLVLNSPAVAGSWSIEYRALRELPQDDLTAVDLPDGDIEIVVLLAASGALLRRSIEASKRGLESSSLATIRVAEAWERAAESSIRARLRRAVGGVFEVR